MVHINLILGAILFLSYEALKTKIEYEEGYQQAQKLKYDCLLFGEPWTVVGDDGPTTVSSHVQFRETKFPFAETATCTSVLPQPPILVMDPSSLFRSATTNQSVSSAAHHNVSVPCSNHDQQSTSPLFDGVTSSISRLNLNITPHISVPQCSFVPPNHSIVQPTDCFTSQPLANTFKSTTYACAFSTK